MRLVDLSDLPEDIQRLIDSAERARLHAYSDYSHFKVGAAVGMRMPGGSLLIGDGCNVENAAYTGGHAEHGAIHRLAMLLPAGKKPFVDMAAIALVATRADQEAIPCGLCLQWLREFGNNDMVIYGVKLNEQGIIWQVQQFTFGELLSHSFGPNNLK